MIAGKLGLGKVPEFLWVFKLVGRFPWVSGRFCYPPGSMLKTAFQWLCFCREKPPCTAATIALIDWIWWSARQVAGPKTYEKHTASARAVQKIG